MQRKSNFLFINSGWKQLFENTHCGDGKNRLKQFLEGENTEWMSPFMTFCLEKGYSYVHATLGCTNLARNLNYYWHNKSEGKVLGYHHYWKEKGKSWKGESSRWEDPISVYKLCPNLWLTYELWNTQDTLQKVQ